MTLHHLNPAALASSRVSSQGVRSTDAGLLFVGGQNGSTRDGDLLEGFAEQTAQAYRNVLAVLAEAGCTQEDVMKLNIFIVGDLDVREGLAAAQGVWGQHPTAVTVLRVYGLARPDALVEIDAVAEAPGKN